jgi:hypothetical protein
VEVLDIDVTGPIFGGVKIGTTGLKPLEKKEKGLIGPFESLEGSEEKLLSTWFPGSRAKLDG